MRIRLTRTEGGGMLGHWRPPARHIQGETVTDVTTPNRVP
jgi:hypothetical protein